MEYSMPGSTPTTRKPLWIIIGCFSVVLIANGFLVFFALTTWTGLETEQPYVKGLAYNTNLESAKRQQALAWQVKFTTSFEPGEENSANIQAHFTDGAGRSLIDLDVRILVTRPTHAGYDLELALVHSSDGIYRGDLTLPLKGQWDFRILARRGEDVYQRVERIVTP
jgi:nitrogen fixation protein FixH